MRKTNRTLMRIAVTACLALATWPGCSETRADPLEVTYYYLPG